MITRQQMFTNPTTGRSKPHSLAQARAVDELLDSVNPLMDDFSRETGHVVSIDPDTGTQISGERNGSGGGGFRERGEGKAERSSHKVLWVQLPDGGWIEDEKEAEAAVDGFDPANLVDLWLDKYEQPDGRNTKLEQYGLYREHPDDTPGWFHLTKRAPRSGKRTFKP